MAAKTYNITRDSLGDLILTTSEEFDWLKMLRSIIAGKVTVGPYLSAELRQLAMDWPTCACGQLCKVLPRLEGGAPEDYRLADWGSEFAGAISGHQWQRALELFEKIEKRTTLLLNESSYRRAV